MEKTRKDRIRKIQQNRAARADIDIEAGPRAVFNQLLSNVLMTSRADMLSHLFDPRRDIDEECGYPTNITDHQYRRMYDRGLGRRVVGLYPSETWKEFPDIYEDADPDTETPFEAALTKLDKSRHLLHFLERADELSGVGSYGIILWGFNDGKALNEPVEGFERWAESTGDMEAKPTAPERKLLFIRALDASLVTIADFEQDVTNPRYGLPIFYNITLADPRHQQNDGGAQPNATQTKVHWTRVTHIADNRKTSEVMGTPRQEAVWDRLYDLRKILSGSGEMFWRGGFPGLSLETQTGTDGAELDEEGTRAMMQDYMNGLQRYIALTGMSAKSLAPQIADPTQSFEAQVKAICITLAVPYRVFMGIEEGVVSGDQATKAWDTRLANRQARYVTPMIINPVLQRLIDAGVLPPTAEPMGWTVEWPPLEAPDELRDADVTVKKTEALAKYVQGGVDTLIPPLEFLTIFCGLDEDTAETILEAAIDHIEDIEKPTPTPGHAPGPTPEEMALEMAKAKAGEKPAPGEKTVAAKPKAKEKAK